MQPPQNAIRYAITDRAQYAGNEAARHASVVKQAGRLAAEDVDFLQLREKDLPTQDLIGLARGILSAVRSASCKATGLRTRLLINSRADVALAAGADGVHIPSGEDQLTPSQVRELFASAGTGQPIVSVSCHSLDDIARARDNAADLILFGPVFGKIGKTVDGKIVVPEAGLELLAAACKLAGETPVLALGGVTAANTTACVEAGARGIAAIRLFH